jgi:pimeloyl-ACP methyl ester carboxylesterase
MDQNRNSNQNDKIEIVTNTQLIVMPQAGHGPQHQYPDLAAKYIASFIENSKESNPQRSGL